MGLPLKTVRKLQIVQTVAAHVVAGVYRFNLVGPLLWQLRWQPVHFQAQFEVLVLTLRALYSFGPGYFRDHFLQYNPSCPLRSSDGAILTVLPTR